MAILIMFFGLSRHVDWLAEALKTESTCFAETLASNKQFAWRLNLKDHHKSVVTYIRLIKEYKPV
jgi:hypothetical protein